MKMRSSVRGLAVSELRFFAHSITPHNTVLMRNACSEAEALEAVFACLVHAVTSGTCSTCGTFPPLPRA